MLEDRLLVIPTERLTFATCPGGKVLMNLDYPSEKLGLPPDIHLALEFFGRISVGCKSTTAYG